MQTTLVVIGALRVNNIIPSVAGYGATYWKRYGRTRGRLEILNSCEVD